VLVEIKLIFLFKRQLPFYTANYLVNTFFENINVPISETKFERVVFELSNVGTENNRSIIMSLENVKAIKRFEHFNNLY